MKKIVALIMALCMVLCSVAAIAEAEKTYTVGILQLLQHVALDAATQGFKDVLTEKLGDKVVFDEQNAQNESSICSQVATTFVSNSYDLVMGNATPAVQALVAATVGTDTPVIGVSVTDYATALEMPDLDINAGTGINVTGISDGVSAQLYADCVMELVPNAKKVAIVYCSAEPNSIVQADNFIACMEAYNVECSVYKFNDSNDIQSVVTAAVEGVDAMYIPTDNTAASNMNLVRNVTGPAKLPVICGEEGMMSIGGLATVSISYYDLGVMAGEQAYEILVNGADVATMPIGYSPKAVKEYNPGYAEEIGFAAPEGYAAFGE